MTRRRHLVRFVAAATLLLVALGSSGCSSTLADAATVNDVHISRRDLNDDLSALMDNAEFVKVLREQGGYTAPTHRKTITTALAARWLSLLIQEIAIDRELDARHLEVGARQLAAARANVDNDYGGKNVVDAFPKDFRDKIVEREARYDVLADALAESPPRITAAQARQFYDQNKSRLFPCPSAKTVAHIVVATQAEANDVLAQLRAGADFATLAQQRSSDPATRQDGGVLSSPQAPTGCYVAGSSPQLDDAVNGASPNQPTGPVQTQSGWEVVEVRPYTPPTFEQVEAQLIATLQRQVQSTAANNRQAAVASVVQKRLRTFHVDVDPRYGRWVYDRQGGRVEPPTEPEIRDRRERTPTTTTIPGLNTGG